MFTGVPTLRHGIIILAIYNMKVSIITNKPVYRIQLTTKNLISEITCTL